MEVLKKFRLLPCCIGVWLLGAHWGHAEYPDHSILWHHLLGQDHKGYTVPDIYKELLELQKNFEAEKEKGLLQEEDQKERLRFFWEEEQSTKSYTLTEVTFDTSAMFKDRMSINTLFRWGVTYYPSIRLVDFGFEEYVEADEGIKGALCRCLRVILSEQFLSRVWGESYVCELFGRCKKMQRFCSIMSFNPSLKDAYLL